ncbi:hypothetical protein IKE13_02460 [Candidatus Saccharibacteria bacterium]|nr:hypothetical protein [Candidatus Saccharibacteria bacterium]MBR2803028.1 hypothetical protein [Candidatus Saccharibacteria bacterium]
MVKKNKTHDYLITTGIIAIVLVIILLIFFLLQGQTKISGKYPDDYISEALVCSQSDLTYPFYEYNNSTSQETKIISIFENDKIANISLVQTLFYNDYDSAFQSEARNHASMNYSFDDLGPDALNARYSIDNEKMQMTLYAESKNLDYRTYKYFLLNVAPNSLQDLMNHYEKRGFTCNKQ